METIYVENDVLHIALTDGRVANVRISGDEILYIHSNGFA